MLRIGIPAGAEFALMAVYIVVIYAIIRNFGAAAQAGFGIGMRVMQAIFLPVIAVAFAVAPVVGQNFGGRQAARVRQAFFSAAAMTSGIMVVLTLLCQIAPDTLIRAFSNDASVIMFGSDYLRIVSFNFVAVGLTFTSSSVFQGIGNTWPPLLSSATRLIIFVLPAIIMSRLAGFELKQVWYLSVATVLCQAGVNLLLLRREFQKKLNFPTEDNIASISGSATSA
jgi:Na+-driven multidrug efflux pump